MEYRPERNNVVPPEPTPETASKSTLESLQGLRIGDTVSVNIETKEGTSEIRQGTVTRLRIEPHPWNSRTSELIVGFTDTKGTVDDARKIALPEKYDNLTDFQNDTPSTNE